MKGGFKVSFVKFRNVVAKETPFRSVGIACKADQELDNSAAVASITSLGIDAFRAGIGVFPPSGKSGDSLNEMARASASRSTMFPSRSGGG